VLEIEIILLLFFRALPPENLDPIDIFTLINPDSIKPGQKSPYFKDNFNYLVLCVPMR
jgi:hypothetical protein